MNSIPIYLRDTDRPIPFITPNSIVLTPNDVPTIHRYGGEREFETPRIVVTKSVYLSISLDALKHHIKQHLNGKWMSEDKEDLDANDFALLEFFGSVYDKRVIDDQVVWFVSHMNYETVICKSEEL